MTDRAVPPAGRSVLRRLAPRAVLPPLWRELAPAPDTMTQPPAPVPETPGLGEPVLLVPGFLVGDASLGQLAAYLGRAGYVPHPAGITRNVGCSEATVQVVVARLERLAECYGAPVAIVGHSRGGLLARVAARRRPDLVAGVVTLGSPHRDQLAVHPLVWASAVALATLGVCGVPGVLRFSCSGGGCCARFWDDVSAPRPGAALPVDLHPPRRDRRLAGVP